ncbi:DUF1254 domain-containing protein [Cupriavidus basilensis]|uniref:DUF1254 domain-containing protein n=1 Tax=Cupriavidus sp. TaxID=1873897 RepID=UPI003D0F3A19
MGYPTVVELPPKMPGLFDDMWMCHIVGGGIAGPDKGQGGKLLFLPPHYKGDAPRTTGFHRRIRGSAGLIGNNTGHRFQGLL